jgi:8-oxo-dGTP pyrophosphatase MutT (NUDIX family)
MKIVSSGFVILNRHGEILLGRVDSHSPPYQYTVFKGQQEENESLLDTAIRELKEETGINIASEHRLNRYISANPIFIYHLSKKDVYLFSLEDVEGVLDNFEFFCSSLWGNTNQPEISGYKWVKIEDLHDYVFPSQRGLASFLQKKYSNEVKD